jgi:hypothetical protein
MVKGYMPLFRKKYPQLLWLDILLGVGIICLVVFGLYTKFKPEKTPTEHPYPFYENKLTQGETIHGLTVTLADIEQTFVDLFEDTPENRTQLTLWQLAADTVTANAILQSEGMQQGIIQGSSTYDPDLAQAVRDYFNDQEGTIDGEIITVWFQETEISTDETEATKTEIYNLLTRYREQIHDGIVTMQNAASEINENSFTKIYGGAEYSTFTDSTVANGPVADSTILEEMWQYQENEVTVPLLGQTATNGVGHNAYYSLIKIAQKNTIPYQSADQLVQVRISEGKKITLERI